MLEQEIMDGNILITKFMDLKFGIHKYLVDEGDEYNYKFKPEYCGLIFKDNLPENKNGKSGYDFHEYKEGFDPDLEYGLKYHSSWDSLMYVVKKINSLDYLDLWTVYNIDKWNLTNAICTVDIDHAFELCVKFVNWYNLYKNEN